MSRNTVITRLRASSLLLLQDEGTSTTTSTTALAISKQLRRHQLLIERRCIATDLLLRSRRLRIPAACPKAPLRYKGQALALRIIRPHVGSQHCAEAYVPHDGPLTSNRHTRTFKTKVTTCEGLALSCSTLGHNESEGLSKGSHPCKCFATQEHPVLHEARGI